MSRSFWLSTLLFTQSLSPDLGIAAPAHWNSHPWFLLLQQTSASSRCRHILPRSNHWQLRIRRDGIICSKGWCFVHRCRVVKVIGCTILIDGNLHRMSKCVHEVFGEIFCIFSGSRNILVQSFCPFFLSLLLIRRFLNVIEIIPIYFCYKDENQSDQDHRFERIPLCIWVFSVKFN